MRKLILAVVLVAACGGKKDKDKPAASGDAAGKVAVTTDGGGKPATTDGGAKPAPRDGGVAAKRAPLVERGELEALMTAWLEAQNGGDFAAYSALYAEGFKGVRRSGKQTVRLDRAGWLKDRKKMFGKPMLVAARDVEIVLGEGRATAKFTQEWSSGKYHDVGPKLIEVVADAGKLLISREELLASKIVKPAKPRPAGEVPPVLRVMENMIVLTADVDPSWASGEPRLLDGEIRERDASCDDDPPDYEEDHERYWECEASDPDSGHDEFAASVTVGKSVPATYSAWIGQTVRITNDKGVSCQAVVDHLELYAEIETTFSQVTTAGSDDEAIAGAVLDGEPVLVAKVAGGCTGAWAQLASAPEALPWKRAPAPADLASAVLADMRAGGADELDLDNIEVEVLTSPDGKQLVYASRDGHACMGIASVTVVYAVEGGKLGDAVLDDPDVYVIAAVDPDGDGWPELVLGDGVARYDATIASYDHTAMIKFPDEIEEQCGE